MWSAAEFLVVAGVLFAGCAAPGPATPLTPAAPVESPQAGPVTPAPNPDAGQPPTPSPTNAPAAPAHQSFHLGPPPAVSLADPGPNEVATPLAYPVAPGIGESVAWTYRFGRDATITAGNATLWVRATDLTLGRPPCTWDFRILRGADVLGSYCGVLSGPLAPGDYAITAPLAIGSGSNGSTIHAGDSVTFAFAAYTTSTTERVTLFALTNSTRFDARVVLVGADEPGPPAPAAGESR